MALYMRPATVQQPVFASQPQPIFPPGKFRRTTPYQEAPQSGYSRNRTSGYTVCLVVLVFILVLLLIGALVWGAIVTNKALNREVPLPTRVPPPPITVPTTTRTPPTTRPPIINEDLVQFDKTKHDNYIDVEGTISVPVWTWDSTLSDKNSIRFKDYEGEFCEIIELVFDKTSIAGGLKKCQIEELNEHFDKGVSIHFELHVWPALDVSVIALYRLVMNQIHCGLNDLSLNYRFTIYNEEVDFEEWTSGMEINHEICGPPGTCIRSGLNYECPCQEGFQYAKNGFMCEDYNECLWQMGGCEHICINTEGSSMCDCDMGYELLADSTSCKDIDECDLISPTHNCNKDTEAFCVNRMGDFYCQCPNGMALEFNDANNEYDCVDLNECLMKTDDCSQLCENSLGSYICKCRDGYELMSDGRTCQDIDECAIPDPDNVCAFPDCVNTDGGFECTCIGGFEAVYDALSAKYICTDINECEINDGDCEQICENTIESFVCGCHEGYVLDNDKRTCNNINECTLGDANCAESAEVTCVDTVGSYICTCDDGYLLSANGKECTEINECQDDMGGCDQSCENTPGSFECTCLDGYTWNAATETCDDTDECALWMSDCPGNAGKTKATRCVNTIASFYCDCEIGYYRDGNGEGTCINYNECLNATTNLCNAGGVATCVDEETSTNPGGFECECPATFYEKNADEITCDDVDECATDPCTTAPNFYCINNEGAAESCVCPLGTAEHPAAGAPCTDIDECTTLTDPCAQICVNDDPTVSAESPSYHCTCYDGYSLAGDGVTCNDIDECTTSAPDCSTGSCVNTIGGFNCNGCSAPDNEFQGPDGSACIEFAVAASAATVSPGGTIQCELTATNIFANAAATGTAPSVSRFEWVKSDGTSDTVLSATAQSLTWDASNTMWVLALDLSDASVSSVVSDGDALLCRAEYVPPTGTHYNDYVQVNVVGAERK